MNAMMTRAGLSAAPFLARYEGLRERLPGARAARDAAARALAAEGLPGPRDEAWKYTHLRALTETPFHETLTDASAAPTPVALPALGALADGPRLVFLGGRFRADLSVLPQGISLGRTEGEGAGGAGAIRLLNMLLAEDGAVLDVAPGVDAGTVVLLSLAEPGAAVTSCHLRHRITLGTGARLALLDISSGHGTYFINPVMDVTLAEGARLTHARLLADSPTAFHLGAVDAEISAGASYDGFTLTTGGRLVRSELTARLSGPGAHAALNAAQVLGGTQHADFSTLVTHAAPGCASRQTVKHVLDGKSRGVFQGKIEVHRAAQKTDGYQMNQTLLLSPDAEIDSKPQLEIFADDVKCSHGATVGELDADQLFYMVSRGISRADARALLIRAFLDDALGLIEHDAMRGVCELALAEFGGGA